MNLHMPNRNGPRSAEPGAAGAAQTQMPTVEADRLAEALSAWMDGEALPAGVDEAVLLQWLLHDEQAQNQWRQWQVQADCLHAQSLHGWVVGEDQQPFSAGATRATRQCSSIRHAAVVGSAAWSERLNQRLAQTQVGSGDVPEAVLPLSAPMRPAVPADAPPVAQAVAPETVTLTKEARATPPATRTPAEAANDPVWRWKLAAGFASVAAVGVTLWSLLGQPAAPNVPGVNGPLLAVQTPGGAASLLADEGNTGSPTQLWASELQNGAEQSQTVAEVATAAADDPYAEALLQAHSQLGDNLPLQDALFTEKAEQDEAF